MFNIHYLNKISPKGTELWTEDYAVGTELEEADAILVRSADMHTMELPENLLAVSRAGAGVNNIPLTSCAEKGIVVFNTPGANARSVMELALCGMLLASRDIIGGVNWVQTIKSSPDVAKLVEKGIASGCGTDAPGSYIAWLCTQTPVHAMEMPGSRYDIGNLESYAQVQQDYRGITK